ncbi:MAG: hypothetical protein KDD15_32765, partial [Lewinella sp.]|nr:hypothetical protein [Lewinella sp.]
MYKAIQVIFLLCLLSCTAYSQTILLKMGEDANMKYEDEKNKIIAPSEGIKTDKKEIFLMAGFPEAAQTRKKVTFSITGTDDCKITYNGALRQNLSLNGNILRYLELIKVEFLADQVEGSIVIKVNNEGELTYPLQYNVPGAAAGDQNTPDAGNSVTDNDQNATGQDSTTDVEVDPSKVNAPPTPNPNPPPNPWKSAFLILLFLTVSAGILGFILYRRLKHDANEKSEKPDEETTGATDAEEAIQLALLNHLMGGEGEATNHYSTGIQEKVAMVKDRYGLSEKQNVDQAAYRKLEEQVRQSQLENSQLQTQVQEADQTLHETRQLLDKVAYPPYYLTFNDGLQEVFQDLEKAREHLKSESHFNEIFNKIMNHSSKQVPHPLLWFAGRDKHVLNSLDLNSRDELANLDKDTFFEKYVL